MSDIRKRGIAYLSKRVKKFALVAVSKKYCAEESWTGKEAWWFDIPIDKVKVQPDELYYLLCEKENGEFHILRVPNKFLIDNMDQFETRYDNKIRVHMDAEETARFLDQRGTGKVDLSPYVIDA